MIKLSIIIPFYNVSAYLERCVRSLMQQTLQEGIEFIFVDDGSSDASANILKSVLLDYPERAGQVLVLTKPLNQGVAAARLTGMLAARGEYMIHCDADDWVDPEIYAKVCNSITTEHPDIIVVPLIHEYGDYNYPELTQQLAIEECFFHKRWWGLCSHALRRSLIEKYQLYPEAGMDMWEDLYLLMRYFSKAKTISYIKEPLYHYDRMISDSILHRNVSRDGVQSCVRVIQLLTTYFQQNAPQYLPAILLLKRIARDIYLEGDSPDFESWCRCYPETWRVVWHDDNLGLPYRLCYVLGSYHFTIPMRMLLFVARVCR